MTKTVVVVEFEVTGHYVRPANPGREEHSVLAVG